MTVLDLKCASYGEEIIKKIDRPAEKNKIMSMVNKALGVLMEDGLYAFALYTKSESGDGKAEERAAKFLYQKTHALLKDGDIALITNNDYLSAIRSELGNSVDKLLLAKELVERTLVYARYHAKALQEERTWDGKVTG